MVAHSGWKMAWDAGLGIEHIIVEEAVVGCCHFAVLGGVIIISWVALLTFSTDTIFEVKDGEGADVAYTINMDCKLAEEVNDLVAAFGKAEPE